MGLLQSFWYTLMARHSHLVVLLLVFGAVTCISFALYLFFRKDDQPADRLARLQASHGMPVYTMPSLLEKEKKSFFTKFADKLSGPARAVDEELKESPRLRLMQAGLRSRTAFRNFVLAQFGCTLLLPVGYILYSRTYAITPKALLICVVCAAVGCFLPVLYVENKRQHRQENISKGLPDALDLMVICVTAGLGLDMTFNRVGAEIHEVWPDLADEFYLTNLEIRAGKQRDGAYKNMALRAGITEMQSLMSMLSQTNRFGTSVAEALRVHAEGMRTKRRQQAEEQAAKSAVKIMIPLVLFILPALFVVVIGPGSIRIMRSLLPALSGH